MNSYNPNENEAKWQKAWRESGIFKADLENSERPKYYNLTMFPYPSGDKLHIGHWYNYAPVDTWGRYMKMKGFEVFQPMGFDSFGLPAENYAIKTGVHPAETTRTNIDKMKEQIAAIGGMYDLDLNLETSSPEYYKWTQWVFLQLYKNGLAERREAPVNWCTSCQTVLANEQVVEGICERCKNEVIRKNLTQWFFKITDYAEQLLDYEGLDWPEKTIAMQKNWIGKSEGVNINFKIADSEDSLTCYTTRPDTLYSVTFMVIAPEHPLVEKFISGTEYEKEVRKVTKEIQGQTDIERTSTGGKDKLGAYIGVDVINPANGEKIPVYIANFALMYGTGVVMADAHDERDFEFAQKYDIPLKFVVSEDGSEIDPKDFDEAYVDDGILFNSGEFTGMNNREALPKMAEWIEKDGFGEKTINFRLRDWLISRQRYWGAPIPIIYCEKCGEVPVPEEDLPVVHPHIEDYVPKGQSPLAGAEDFVNVNCPKCDSAAKREVDTMDTFVCSSWYFLRYPDAMNSAKAWEKEHANKWMPVDMYIGGPEHACMHLLYARFIHKAMNNFGFVDSKEPFKRLVHQGMVTKDGAKMSKSKGNVVSPDEFVEKYGSDVFRMYLMFMGPFTDGGDWNDQGITGVARFVDRFFRMMQIDGEADDALVHGAVKRAGEAVEKMNFNIAIAALMELTNSTFKTGMNTGQKEMVVRVLAPLAPHLAEEIWEMLGHKESVFLAEWPEADEKFLVTDSVTYAVQVNGKLRATLELAKELGKEEALEAARSLENVAKYLKDADVKKEIFVPGKIIGFVV
ncbi:leucine--tRNA ligase [Candidatus Peregrinibacteria bacterium]|jgi:leucyl-tRNA synthetase|nr:leucine--tRNA ligase [Candidatus Peregrinibacteria bacterium]MBT4631418.1 leucine--tRNA ligase [Candidatus Peregrinibacteria bacterium]MBT5516927.1 leucine--tRNA ligase [Candidatus Peregrinibacteria bacterium]MBT5823997.1 leucine--tRNA ligase [Candidatus Peregrinibacteria bacterium]